MDRLEQLTAQQEALLPAVRDEWLRIGLCTDRADRPAAEAGVAAAYRAAGLEPPRVAVWLGSPMAGCIGAALVDSVSFTGRLIDQAICQTEGEVWDQIADPVWDEVLGQARGEVWEEAGARFWEEVGDQVWDWALEETEELFYGGLVEQVQEDRWINDWVSVEGQVRKHVLKMVERRVEDPVRDQVWTQVAQQVKEQIREQGEEQQWYDRDQKKLELSKWGQHAADKLSLYEVFRRFGLPGAERLDGHAAVARAAGWWWAFRHVVILTERPAELHLDDQGRLHCPDGMAIRYPDGWGFHAWHGRRVPAWVVQSPTIEQITAESDTEVRRCAIEAIEVGDPERAIALHQQTLDESRRVLGEDHPDTLAARNNLACAYWEARDLERAIALFERVLDELRRVLGEDHLHTLTCRTSLANVYRMAGDLERAIPLYQQALDENRRVLGDAHKLTRDVIARLEECGERI